MKALLLVTFLASAWWCAQALTPGEVKALQDLRENFNTSSLRWPEGNLTNACELTHEHPYFGIACNTGPDPHVISLYVSLFCFALYPRESLARFALQRALFKILLPSWLIILNSHSHATPNLEPTFVPESIGGLAWLVSLYVDSRA